MVFSLYFLLLRRQTRKKAGFASHRLMRYTFRSLALRVVSMVYTTKRKEQDRAAAIELLMRATQSTDLWWERRRRDVCGKEMLCIKERFCAALPKLCATA
jgi:prolyl-tRNA synthetase